MQTFSGRSGGVSQENGGKWKNQIRVSGRVKSVVRVIASGAWKAQSVKN